MLPNIFSLLLGLCLLGNSLFLSAQTFDPDYRDGYVYVKIRDESPRVMASAVAVLKDPAFQVLWGPMQAARVREVLRPFQGIQTPTFDRTYRFRFERIGHVDSLIASLQAIAWIEYAERVPLPRKLVVPNDPSWSQVASHLELIQADRAWDLHTGGQATIAIVDDAVQVTHPDLTPNLWLNTGEIPGNGLDDDQNGYVDDVHGFDVADLDGDPNPPALANSSTFSHGTHCAGIASASTDNQQGIAAVGHSCRLMAVKATGDAQDPLFIYEGYAGIAYAIAAGADVISLSWGGGGSSTTAHNILKEADRRGIQLVAAAGNGGNENLLYPAAYPEVLAVANTTTQDRKAPSSSYGTWVDVSAPGTAIYSTVAFNGYDYKTGTSMACPMVAGLLGLMRSYQPGLPKEYYEQVLLETADYIDWANPGLADKLGSGRINAYRALQRLTQVCFPNPRQSGGPLLHRLEMNGNGFSAADNCTGRPFQRRVSLLASDQEALSLGLDLQSCARIQPYQVAVFIDWNGDGDFTDTGEEAGRQSALQGDTVLQWSIVIPPQALRDRLTRLRVVVKEGSAAIDPCGAFDYGHASDWNFTLLAPACDAGEAGIDAFPYAETWEDAPLCDTTRGRGCLLAGGWQNLSDDDLDWLVYQGPTATPFTGPNQGFWPRDSTARYLYVEAYEGEAGREAVLLSPCIDFGEVALPELTFAYHMFGSDMGNLRLEVRKAEGWEIIWSQGGNRQDLWRTVTLDLSGLGGRQTRLRWVASTGAGPRSDLALGLFNLHDGASCGEELPRRAAQGKIEDGSGLIAPHIANADCRWLIQPYNARNLSIRIERFLTLQDQDYLRIFQGEGLDGGSVKALSGYQVDSSFFTVAGGSVYLQFESDALGEQDGWLLAYEAELLDLADVLAYRLDDQAGPVGDTLWVPIRVENFQEISKLSGTLRWDSTGRGVGYRTRNALAGTWQSRLAGNHLTFAWEGAPSTLRDGDTLLEIALLMPPQGSVDLWVATDVAEHRARRHFGDGSFSVLWPEVDTARLSTQGSSALFPRTEDPWLLYPNPFSDYIWVKAPGGAVQSATIRVFDPLGRLKLTQKMHGSTTLNTKAWSAGLYWVEIQDESGVSREKVRLLR